MVSRVGACKRDVDRDLVAGLAIAVGVALVWTIALGVRELEWGQQRYILDSERAAAVGDTVTITAPYVFDHWQFILNQGFRVLLGGMLVAALVHRNRLPVVAASATVLLLAGALTGEQLVVGPLAPGPSETVVAWPWAGTTSLVLALLAPGFGVLLARRSSSAVGAGSRTPDPARSATGTIVGTSVACAGAATVMLAPHAGSLSTYGVSPDTWSSLVLLVVAVCATSSLVASTARPWAVTALLALGGLLLSVMTAAGIETRVDTLLAGPVLIVGPVVNLLAPRAQTTWRRAFRHGPSASFGVARTTTPV